MLNNSVVNNNNYSLYILSTFYVLIVLSITLKVLCVFINLFLKHNNVDAINVTINYYILI